METSIDKAFKAMPRANFLPPSVAYHASVNAPLTIGFGQTNSQPETVQYMLEWLAVEPGDSILDVGSGSGWTSALLAYLTGAEGRVQAVEIVPELVSFGRDNCARMGLKNIEFHTAGKTLGWTEKAPYDRILVSAGATELPQELVDQLKPGGRMVIPIEQSIFIIDKASDGAITQTEKPGFVFVPLI
jgi:protein-L-isoaspartate(D-aspartate) O-methyltransferase